MKFSTILCAMLASHLSRVGTAFSIRSSNSLHRGFYTSRTMRLAASSEGGGGRVSGAVVDKDLMTKTEKKKKGAKQPKLDTNPPKGTRDFYPEDMRLQTWLFSQWREVAKTYGFSEYDAPVLESENRTGVH